MKFRAWFSSSLVLVFALAATVALFHYWDQMKVQSVQMLQDRLNQMELQRFEETKGSLVRQSGRQTAERFNAMVNRYRSGLEKIADSQSFRQPHTRPADRTRKKQKFKQMAMKQKTWHASLITDETGKVLAWTGKEKPPTSIAPTLAYQESSKQRVTAIRILTKSDTLSVLQMTTPCLNSRGVYLGVLQAEVSLSLKTLRKLVAKNGFSVLLISEEGRRLTPGTKPDFPKTLGELLQKDKQAIKTLLRTNSTGYLKADWEKNRYLMAHMPIAISKTYIITLLEVPGLDRVVGPNFANESMFRDPVILGGLGLIVLLGLFLMSLMSGTAAVGARKINRQLTEMMEPGIQVTPLDAPGKGEWEKLTDQINDLLERLKDRSASTGVSETPQVDSQESEQLNQALIQARTELDEIRQQYDQAMIQNQEYGHQIESLQQQNQKENVPPEEPATTEVVDQGKDQIESMMEKFRADGALRIDAIVSMSEDLKATLMVIKNYISSILSSEEGKITDAQQEFLGVVINKSARLERQITDLLDISHMESGVTQLYPSKTDLVSMLQDVVLNSQPQADTKQIKIIQEIQSPLPQVMIDSDRLGQVFINLVQHAIKITSVGGEIQITALETLTDLVVKLRDGGTSLNEQQSECVFQIFHGSDSEAGIDIASSGLRFPIIKRIIDAHQGSIEIRGLPEKGNETIISFKKKEGFVIDEAPAETDTNAAFLDSYEMKPEVKEEATSTETPTAESESEESPYDLTSFMGKLDEFETPAPEAAAEKPADTPSDAESELPGGDDDLNKLLSDIESIDDNT